MWRLKIKTDSSKQFLGSLAIKHDIMMTGYPLTCYRKGKNLYLVAGGFIFGNKSNKLGLIKDLKNIKEFVNIEFSGDFIIGTFKVNPSSEPIYDSRIIRLSPEIINKKGYNIWDMACFERKPLEKVLKFAEKEVGGEIIFFHKEKISNINFTRLLPELTKNQKQAMEIAINNGYYNYPKKINMEKLAKQMGISYSTFQAHLKKAEGKLLPKIFKDND